MSLGLVFWVSIQGCMVLAAAGIINKQLENGAMRTLLKVLSVTGLVICPSLMATARAAVQQANYRFVKGQSPAVFVDASGEGCCNFTFELEGGFQLNHDITTGQVWTDNIEIVITSTVTLRLGVPVTDPQNVFYSLGKDWLDGRPIDEVIPGFFTGTMGLAENGSYNFGPGITPNNLYAWRYTIHPEGTTGILSGESLFRGSDGAYFYVNASFVSVVPEPPVGILLISALAVMLLGRNDYRGSPPTRN